MIETHFRSRVGSDNPASVFRYCYAILNSVGYRKRYGQVLREVFPGIPTTRDSSLFDALSSLGNELIQMHLLESPLLEKPITTYTGPAKPEVEKVSYGPERRGTVWLDKNQKIGFTGVPEAVWNFHIGGYQVCEKWLKDRKGRTLTPDDLTHYQKIVVALNETIRLMKEIDEVIDKHGGWPGAFVTNTKPPESPKTPQD
jgi:predicted helicase